MNQNELYHYGTKGQHWGIRRYQNPDGSLTPAGKKRYGTVENFNKVQKAKKSIDAEAKQKKYEEKATKEIDKYRKKSGLEESHKTESSKKSVKDMSNEELNAAIERKRLEDQYRKAFPQKASMGRRFINDMKSDETVHAIGNAVRKAGANYIQAKIQDMTGVRVNKLGPELMKEFSKGMEVSGNKNDGGSKKGSKDKKKNKSNTEPDNDHNKPDNNSNNKLNPESKQNDRGSSHNSLTKTLLGNGKENNGSSHNSLTKTLLGNSKENNGSSHNSLTKTLLGNGGSANDYFRSYKSHMTNMYKKRKKR